MPITNLEEMGTLMLSTQFVCRIILKEKPSRESTSTLVQFFDMYWMKVSGINLVVCGYTMQVSVLLELRHVCGLSSNIHEDKTSADSFMSDQIGFSNNARNSIKLVRPFVEQLSLFESRRGEEGSRQIGLSD